MPFILTGCGLFGQKVSYKFNTSETIKYKITSASGEPRGNNKSSIKNSNRTLYLFVKPYKKRENAIWLNVLWSQYAEPKTEIQKFRGEIADNILMDNKGKILDRYGTKTPFKVELLFPELPYNRFRIGKNWEYDWNGMFLLQNTKVKLKYTFKGQRIIDGNKCLFFIFSSRKNDSQKSKGPGGYILSSKYVWEIDGEFYWDMKQSKPYSCTFKEAIDGLITNPANNDVILHQKMFVENSFQLQPSENP